jgi:hypothetical protein
LVGPRREVGQRRCQRRCGRLQLDGDLPAPAVVVWRAACRDDRDGIGVGKHLLLALGRKLRIHRYVRGPRDQRAEDRHNQFGRAADADRDQLPAADAMTA